MTRKEGYRVRKSAGNCYRCFARKADQGGRCWYCADRQREYNREYARRKRNAADLR